MKKIIIWCGDDSGFAGLCNISLSIYIWALIMMNSQRSMFFFFWFGAFRFVWITFHRRVHKKTRIAEWNMSDTSHPRMMFERDDDTTIQYTMLWKKGSKLKSLDQHFSFVTNRTQVWMPPRTVLWWSAAFWWRWWWLAGGGRGEPYNQYTNKVRLANKNLLFEIR